MNRALKTGGVTLGILAVLAVTTSTASAQIPGINQSPDQLDLNSIVKVLVYLIQFGLAFAAAVGAIYIVVSGYQYVMSAGNPEKVEKAKNGLTWAITGFILAISASAIVLLLQQTLQSKNQVTDQLGNQPGPQSAAQVITSLIDLGLKFAAAVAVLFLILGGYRYITSQGNRDLAEGAKNTVLYSLIGLIVAMLSYAIFLLITSTLGITNP